MRDNIALRLTLSTILILLFPNNAMAHENGLSDNYFHVGKGCTTGFYIDDDCDGYGIGEEFVLGPDADETDPDVNTPASAIAKYGDMGTFIKARMQALTGITDGGIRRFVVLDPVNGNDSTGVKSADFDEAYAHPFLTWGVDATHGIKPGSEPGDCY